MLRLPSNNLDKEALLLAFASALILATFISFPLAPLFAIVVDDSLSLPWDISLPKSCIKFTTSFPELKDLFKPCFLNMLLKLLPSFVKKPCFKVTSLVAIASNNKVIVSS